MFQALATLLSCLAISTIVECRDASKAIKSIPTITSSLVNLGKMDISFYFNANANPKDTQMKADGHFGPSNSFLFSKSEPVEEPCPCSSLRNVKDSLSHLPSSDMLSKILMSNDLFSYNREPTSSTMCCESHEHDDFVTYEIGPKHANLQNVGPYQPNLARLPFIFENMIPRKPTTSIHKKRALEIFLFPKSQELMPVKQDLIKKDMIQIVGDKELRNDFKNMKLRPSVPLSSVKKDLTAQENNEMKKVADVKETAHTMSTPSHLNTL